MKVNKTVIESGKRYGYLIARDEGDHILLEDCRTVYGGSSSYRIYKKKPNQIIRRFSFSAGPNNKVVRETKLNRNQLEKIINSSEKKYRKDHSLFNKIKEKINDFFDL